MIFGSYLIWGRPKKQNAEYFSHDAVMRNHQQGISTAKTTVSEAETAVSETETTQSKVKESKDKYIKRVNIFFENGEFKENMSHWRHAWRWSVATGETQPVSGPAPRYWI